MSEIQIGWNSFIESISNESYLPTLRGTLILLVMIGIISLIYTLFKTKKLKHFGEKFIVLFELLFEKIYEFFEEIIGKEQSRWIKSTVI